MTLHDLGRAIGRSFSSLQCFMVILMKKRVSALFVMCLSLGAAVSASSAHPMTIQFLHVMTMYADMAKPAQYHDYRHGPAWWHVPRWWNGPLWRFGPRRWDDARWWPRLPYNGPVSRHVPCHYRPMPVCRTYINAHMRWCYDRYRSCRAHDNTYQSVNGPRRQCHSPFI